MANELAVQDDRVTVTAPRTLRSLDGVRPLYMLPADPLAEEVLIPGFQAARKVDCMVGFFSSEVLASLAPGLATYVTGSESSFRLVCKPPAPDRRPGGHRGWPEIGGRDRGWAPSKS